MMASDDFITLEPSGDSEHQEEENSLHESNSVPSEAECGTSTDLKGVPDGDNLEANEENDEIEEGEHVQDMDLETPEQAFIKENPKLLEETPKEIEPENSPDNVCVHTITEITATNLLIDDSPIAGVKRARMTYVDHQACVRVVYNSLTRESKKKLMELMQQWSEGILSPSLVPIVYHGSSNFDSEWCYIYHFYAIEFENEISCIIDLLLVNSKEALESGEETYFPALHVGSENTSAVSFWVDNQARNEDIKSIQLDNDLVPLYDRGYTLDSTSLGGSADSRMGTLEASRCFNCGSYSHSLKECPKPRDNAAINNARKQHNAKRNPTPGSRGQVRYYQKSQGKFDDLKPGFLTAETRECLGIGELDPPPWLHRMRELGYPPGYLDGVEDEDLPSGITIFADEEPEVEYEDTEIPEKGEPVPPEKKLTVEFPGINAPIPENADHRRWTSPSQSSRNRSHYRPTRLLDSQRAHYSDHRRNDGPPGAEHGAASGYQSSDTYRGQYRDRQRDDCVPGMEYGSGYAAHSYSTRYDPYDQNNSPHAARSPNLGRSFSDRGWQSPAGYDGPHSPYPHPSGSRDPPAHPHQSPSASLDRWAPSHVSQYAAASDVPSQPQAAKERQDHHHHHHHHQRHHRN